MSNENSNSKNSPENKKRSWHKEPWYKRLFDKILVSYFLPCKHEWEVLEDGKVETYPLDRLKVITKRER